MRIDTVKLLTLAALAVVPSIGLSQSFVPDNPDLMIKTRATYQSAPVAQSFTNVIYLKGPRARREMNVEGRTAPDHLSNVDITQCDERRWLMLNSQARTYVFRPFASLQPHIVPPPRDGVPPPPPPPPMNMPPDTRPTVTVTVDAVDTGERRQFVHYAARHVITTAKAEPGPGATTPASVSTIDGWYLDLPDASCSDPKAQAGTGPFIGALGGRIGGVPDRVERKQLGTARRGYAIEEVNTHAEGTAPPITVSRTELIELSEATLDPSLFTAPADYLPALTRLDGGIDFTKQDTLPNRVGQYYQAWENWAQAWINYFLHGSAPQYGRGY